MLYTLFVLFAIYSFLGWLLEVIYRTYSQKKLVNAGFLLGPFVPIYGFGALAVAALNTYISGINIAAQFLLYFVLLTSFEFATGEILERIFKFKLWDYTDDKFNFKGKVCLPFSLAWVVIAFIFIYIIHPFFFSHADRLPLEIRTYITSGFLVYLAIDIVYSTLSIIRVRQKIMYVCRNYLRLNNKTLASILSSIERTIRAFPTLNVLIREKITSIKNNEVRSKITGLVDRAMAERKSDVKEYDDIVADIFKNEQFQYLEKYLHHTSSIMDHVKIVSFLSYKICKFLKLDYVSAARGALLHDFFLYDWRTNKERWHGFKHPRIALNNSLKEFAINDLEKDIILKHMWPLTIMPPVHRESFIVSFVDKYVASMEFVKKHSGAAVEK
jgi:uncharacterized membrane protein